MIDKSRLRFILDDLYRYIAEEKGEKPSQVKEAISKKYGPKPEDECSPRELEQRIGHAFFEGAEQGASMLAYRVKWAPWPIKPRVTKTKKTEKEILHQVLGRILEKCVLSASDPRELIFRFFEYEGTPFAKSFYPRRTYRIFADGSFSKEVSVDRASHVEASPCSRTISKEEAISLAAALERA